MNLPKEIQKEVQSLLAILENTHNIQANPEVYAEIVSCYMHTAYLMGRVDQQNKINGEIDKELAKALTEVPF